ncbi:MAG TPA: twin-arginine translocase subunit TatC [Candidatus Nanopelagicales bacterium]|jgi:sec-independent protein translocase protein TatC|nr:twin-arginine translocase subunit TatC [Candidatus Nanopelagicales bacterium]
MTTTEERPAGRRLRRRRRRNPDGAMSLYEHLRELQVRLFRSALAITVAAVIGWIFYDQLFEIIKAPMDPVIASARAEGRPVILAIGGVTDALTLKLQVAGMTGLLLALPVWLYQLWRYIAPGLHGKERKWAYAFAASATPLFAAGVVFGYTVMPQMLSALLGLTPSSVENIVQVDTYLSFTMQILLFFGIGFLIPLLFLMLNLAGILPGRRFFGWWRGLILGSFVFGAVATPTGDPFWMTMAALPLLTLLVVSGTLMLAVDARRARKGRRAEYNQWADDQTSPLTEAPPDPADQRASDLDAPDDGSA